MDLEPSKENLRGQAMGSGHVTWTSSMSSYMLANLANVVANGTKTSTGFKKVHLNSCAKALNEHFKLALTGDQTGNHIRTWKRKWAKIIRLKNLSAALWDDENCIIKLDHEHYAGHIKDHKGDAEFLNKTIEYYREMATVFGNSLATGKYAKGSNDPLGTEVTEIEDDEATNEEVSQSVNVGESSASKPKRAKIAPSEDDRLQSTLVAVGERLAIAIEKTGKSDDEVPEGLWENMKTLPDFNGAYLSHYYAYLVETPRIARAFDKLDFEDKLVWVARYVSNNFPK